MRSEEMTRAHQMTRAHLGAWGELLVQQQLLTFGIDSARMTTDSGIDLLAYDAVSKKAFSVQVKTRSPRSGGARYSWGVYETKCDAADLFAFSIKNRPDDVWYMTPQDLERFSTRRKNLRILRFSVKPGRSRIPVIDHFGHFRGQAGLMRFIEQLRTKNSRARAAGGN